MTGGSDAAMQLIYLEVEGIKLAYHLTKDAVKLMWMLAKFILCSVKDAPYKKTYGKTNLKNLIARAGGRPLVPVCLDKETWKDLEKELKRHGVLYQAFQPLKCGKRNSVEILIMEKDIAMVQELLSRYKETRVKEDVRNGMSEEQSEQNFNENNRTESMEEFADHVGATAPEEVFEAEMKERFGEDYENNIIQFEKSREKYVPKHKSADGNDDRLDRLADIIVFQDRAENLYQNADVEMQVVYDEKAGKSQILDETETHVKVVDRGRGTPDGPGEWKVLCIPKKNILPPLNQEPDKGGLRKVMLKGNEDIVVEDPAGKRGPKIIKAEELNYQREWNQKSLVAEGKSYRALETEKEFDIEIAKTLIYEENERSVKTRVPGTYEDHVRFLWLEKKDLLDAYDGTFLLASLNTEKEYRLYSEDDKVAETIKGKELKRHYHSMGKDLRQSAVPLIGGKGKGRSL